MIGLDTHEAKHVVVSIDAENCRLVTVSVQATMNAYGRDQPVYLGTILLSDVSAMKRYYAIKMCVVTC